MFGGGGSYHTPAPSVDYQAEETRRAAEEAEKQQKALARNRRGRRSTILTSALGIAEDPNVSYAGKKTLGE